MDGATTLCASCHAKCHSGRCEFLGRYRGCGVWRLHVRIDGRELFVPESRRFWNLPYNNLWTDLPALSAEGRNSDPTSAGRPSGTE